MYVYELTELLAKMPREVKVMLQIGDKMADADKAECLLTGHKVIVRIKDENRTD